MVLDLHQPANSRSTKMQSLRKLESSGVVMPFGIILGDCKTPAAVSSRRSVLVRSVAVMPAAIAAAIELGAPGRRDPRSTQTNTFISPLIVTGIGIVAPLFWQLAFGWNCAR